jgi:FkbM family methyltransferase
MTRTSESLDKLLQEPMKSVRYREQNALNDLLDQCERKVVLFGAGTLGKRALPLLGGLGCKVVAFSDNSPAAWGASIESIPVISPERAASEFGKNCLFLVTIWNDHHWFGETYSNLTRLGCTLISSYAPLFWKFPVRFLSLQLLNDLPHKLYQDASSVLAAEQVWADKDSLHCYRANIRWRALGDARDLPGRPEENTYFPSDLFRINDQDSLLDCGAFDGDTIREFLAKSDLGIRTIHAVEADAISFAKLQAYASALPKELGQRIQLYQCAVGKERGAVRFQFDGSLTSKALETGDCVDVIPIDEFFAENPLSMIKMDIEGAEYDALRGAEKTIERDQPILAICVYHTQSDIWRIPLLVKSMVPEYSFFLRTYEGDGFQTVMYAVPPHRLVNPEI